MNPQHTTQRVTLDTVIELQLAKREPVSEQFRSRFAEYYEVIWRTNPDYVQQQTLEHPGGSYAGWIATEAVERMSQFSQEGEAFQRLRDEERGRMAVVGYVVVGIIALFAGIGLALILGDLIGL